MLRLFGIPESEIAETLLRARRAGVDLDALEITTCLRRGEVEVVTRYEPPAQEVYDAFEAVVRERHPTTLFSDDGTSVDEQVARLLLDSDRTIATAESCTGGLLAGRLTELAGSSAYVLGGLVVYSNEAKTALAGVDPALIERVRRGVHRGRRGAGRRRDRARWTPTSAWASPASPGPTAAREDKPVGTVCFSVALHDGDGPVRRITGRTVLPGGRFDVRDRSTTVALHLVRRLLRRRGGLDAGERPPLRRRAVRRGGPARADRVGAGGRGLGPAGCASSPPSRST